MRIIKGKYATRKMPSPKGFSARPTTDFAKESLFNILFNYFDFEEKRVLDLFSGTGGISYEFASRGCQHITAIEKDYKHFSYIQKVIYKMGIEEISPLRTDVFKYINESQLQYNIIFADPPYSLESIPILPDLIFKNQLLLPQGMFVLEHPKTLDFKDHPHFMMHRHYGSVNFSFFE